VRGIGTTERQLRLLQTLAGANAGATLAELAAEFAVNPKTVRRDLKRLQAIGFPVDQCTEPDGRRRWRLTGPTIVGNGLSFDEAFALVLASSCTVQLEGTPLAEATQSAIRKLSKQFSPTTRRYCESLAKTFALLHPRAVDYQDKADILLQVMIAHEDRQDVLIAYQSRSATEPSTFGLSPYAIRLYNSAIYVIGHSELHKEVRTFKLDRMENAQLSQFPFTIPADFNAESYFAPAFGIHVGSSAPQRVRIHFSRQAARPLAESLWHDSQTIEQHADGTVTFSYHVALSEELVAWILSCGRDATVIEPAGLIQQIKSQVSGIANNYVTSNQPEDS